MQRAGTDVPAVLCVTPCASCTDTRSLSHPQVLLGRRDRALGRLLARSGLMIMRVRCGRAMRALLLLLLLLLLLVAAMPLPCMRAAGVLPPGRCCCAASRRGPEQTNQGSRRTRGQQVSAGPQAPRDHGCSAAAATGVWRRTPLPAVAAHSTSRADT
jgi:hypothetical protein